MGILIDSSVIIAGERGGLDAQDLHESWGDERVAIAAITVSELLHGVHRATTTTRRKRRGEFVSGILARIPVLPFDILVARTHAAIWADLARAGTPIGAHDLQIAATAMAHGLAVATRNERDFGRVDSLDIHVW